MSAPNALLQPVLLLLLLLQARAVAVIAVKRVCAAAQPRATATALAAFNTGTAYSTKRSSLWGRTEYSPTNAAIGSTNSHVRSSCGAGPALLLLLLLMMLRLSLGPCGMDVAAGGDAASLLPLPLALAPVLGVAIVGIVVVAPARAAQTACGTKSAAASRATVPSSMRGSAELRYLVMMAQQIFAYTLTKKKK